MSQPQVNILVPLYNEQDVFAQLVGRLTALMEQSNLSIEVILVDDGSKDRTPSLMAETSLNDERFQSIYLARNFGHQTALTAGMQYVNATEAVMIIDGDLQDVPERVEG